MRYGLAGSGPGTIVLIHEMGGSLESWDDVAGLLPEGYAVLCPDLRGAGMSERVKDLTLDQLADDIRQLVVELGLATPVVMAGIAVGGAVALHCAVRHKELVGALVLMSPALGVPREFRQSRLEVVDTVLRSGMRTIVEGALSGGYPEIMRARDPERYLEFRARWLGNDPESFAATYRMLIDLDLDAELAAIACPACVVAGAHDAVRTPASMAAAREKIPGADFEILDCAHHMSVQEPGLVAELIGRFALAHRPLPAQPEIA
ncbi:alpha/beta fold hydrolase [Bosea caraganae]|nr:alpha/beta hydrolase [Bosea caraganae]